MKTKHLILSLIFLRMVFLAIPDTIVHPYFFNNDGIPASSYFWNQLETVFIAVLIVRWARSERVGVRDSVWALLMVVIYDFLDFACNGNTAYWRVIVPGVGEYPMTNNVFMALAYVLMTWRTEENE